MGTIHSRDTVIVSSDINNYSRVKIENECIFLQGKSEKNKIIQLEFYLLQFLCVLPLFFLRKKNYTYIYIYIAVHFWKQKTSKASGYFWRLSRDEVLRYTWALLRCTRIPWLSCRLWARSSWRSRRRWCFRDARWTCPTWSAARRRSCPCRNRRPARSWRDSRSSRRRSSSSYRDRDTTFSLTGCHATNSEDRAFESLAPLGLFHAVITREPFLHLITIHPSQLLIHLSASLRLVSLTNRVTDNPSTHLPFSRLSVCISSSSVFVRREILKSGALSVFY